MAEAFIFDHLRTPRGKGRPDGGLHGVSPVELLAQVLRELRDRNELDTSLVEDELSVARAACRNSPPARPRIATLNPADC